MSQFLEISLYSILAGLATIAGIYIVLGTENWSRKNSIYLISFSAGVLLSVSLTRLIPEALKLNTNALIWCLVSFVFFYIVEHSIILHSCRENDKCEVHPLDTIALIGMSLHSLLDGVIIGVGFEVSLELGIIATLSVLLHKLPDGISMASILLHSGYLRRKTLIYSWIVAILTPIGAIGAYLLVRGIDFRFLGILTAIAAGSFLYIAAADLIPEIHKKSKIFNIFLVVLGMLVPFLVNLLF